MKRNLSRNFLKKLLIILIITINFSKIILGKSGFMTEPDESVYYKSFIFLKRLSNFNLTGGIEVVFTSRGRPLEVIIKTIPASFQYIIAHIFNLNVFETKSMWVIFGFNLLVYIGILYLIYKISMIFYQNQIIALFGVFLYSALINSYVYLRHVYPYDISLLLSLFVLFQILRNNIDKKKFNLSDSFKYGILSFIALMIYPGYFPFFIALFILYISIQFLNTLNIKDILFSALTYIAGSVFSLFLMEILSRSVGKSYIYNLSKLSGTITQGEFKESAIFIFKYLWEVEKIGGIILLLGIFLFFFKQLYQINNRNKTLFLTSIIFISLFLFYTVILSFFMHKMVVYGRIIHQFMPVFVWMSIGGFSYYFINQRKFYYLSYFVIFLIFINYLTGFYKYNQIYYPKSLYWQYLRHFDLQHIQEISEYEESWLNLPPKRYTQDEKILSKDSIIAVNFQYFFPISNKNKFHYYFPPPSFKPIFEGLHFLNFKAYQYEGYKPLAREIIQQNPIQIKIYKKM